MSPPARPELLLTPESLACLAAEGKCVIADCRFDLTEPAAGRRRYLEGHIPGAHYADLEADLSSPVTPRSGRHPLPAAHQFGDFLARIGWAPERLLVAYDERNGALAARLWWLMRYHGFDAAVLDGGLAAWKQAGLPVEQGEVGAQPGESPKLGRRSQMAVCIADLEDAGSRAGKFLIDARSPDRFTGQAETLDPIAGHIPGARNRPFAANLDPSGRFKSADILRAEFAELLGSEPPAAVVHYCGSGVTACHNQFAMELAGLNGSRIYPGSWSEWIRDPARPVATIER